MATATVAEVEYVVACAHCNALLEHEPGVGWVDDGSYLPTLCPSPQGGPLHTPFRQVK